jgi:hypothetical protein
MTNTTIEMLPTYHLIQIDDEGTRIVSAGHTSARGAALQAAASAWVDVGQLAGDWFANHPEGGERYEIGFEVAVHS